MLSETRITDDGLRHLIGLKNLKTLDFNNTQVTDEGKVALEKELPIVRKLSTRE